MGAAFVPIGRIVKAHGLRGEVSVRPLTDLPLDSFVGLHLWIAPPVIGVRDAVVEAVRRGPKGPLVTLSGVDDIETAASLAGRELLADPTHLPEEIFVEDDDPVGMSVYDDERGLLGTITDVIETGANDVWVVEGDRFGEVLIPVIDDVVLDVDMDDREVHVRLLPGLLEEDD